LRKAGFELVCNGKHVDLFSKGNIYIPVPRRIDTRKIANNLIRKING
jgi:hypothetical protein